MASMKTLREFLRRVELDAPPSFNASGEGDRARGILDEPAAQREHVARVKIAIVDHLERLEAEKRSVQS